MDVGAQPLSRIRGFSLSPDGIRRLAIANAVSLALIIASGATVRLTDSGLGCHHWPGCTATDPLPANGLHSYVEFGNRIVSAGVIFIALATWLLGRGHRRLAALVFFGTLAQAPLGALTVHYHLNPYLVMTHFLLSITILTLGVILAAQTRERMRTQLPVWLPQVGLVVGLSALVLIVSGTLATAAGPHPGSVLVRRLWSFYPAVYWHVRATAVFGVSFALVLAALYRLRAPQLRGGLVLLGVLAVQMTIGEVQYRTHLPWWLVLVHVATAATVWAAAVSFVFSLWRPRRMA
ncbi:MAG TPA: COX15/CtaA family protein [Gaiellaceae bacterium]|jgi:cytochrome c oxidase assembly protein subunit 15|nr:COX15/CtaA family protein [Gaiellaceae bacterium]